jgi:environmental stress-induced protein Ves
VSAELIRWRELAPQAWKNGAGLTRELAVSPPGAGGASFDWRLSIAEVDRDGPFSAFAGIHRCIVLLSGAGMLLRETSGAWQQTLAEPLVPFDFAGEAEVESRLIAGTSQDLNVMTRLGHWRSDVVAIHAAHTTAAADAGLLLCTEGVWHIDHADRRLEASQALLWRGAMPTLHLEPQPGAASLVVVRLLCQDDMP